MFARITLNNLTNTLPERFLDILDFGLDLRGIPSTRSDNSCFVKQHSCWISRGSGKSPTIPKEALPVTLQSESRGVGTASKTLRDRHSRPGVRYSKARQFHGPEKLLVKLRPAYSVKLFFSYVVKGVKVKIAAKFRDTGLLRFEDTKRIMSPEKIRAFRETSLRLGLERLG